MSHGCSIYYISINVTYLYPHFFKPSAHLASGSSDRTSWSDRSPSRSFQRTRQEWSLQRKKKMCILSKRSSFAKILIILNLCSWCSWQLLWKFMGSPSSDIKSLFLVFPNQVGTAAFWKALSALSAVWKIIWMHGSIVGLPKSMQASDFKDSGREFMWIQTSYVYKLQTGNCPSRGKKWHLENQDFALWICHS